ncbi:hypothetical protein FQR65_LT17462 [Abscondita terminalis]|nr:hypothetical protein FQR65_LT17462 [Abscondita terminalis]
MKVTETKLPGCFILEPAKYGDSRGYFMESFNEKTFNDLTGTNTHFVQDNQSYSTRGVLRGLHAQAGDHAQAKLVRVLEGEVIDIAVDVRSGSSTFGQHVAVRLSVMRIICKPLCFREDFDHESSECGVHPLDKDLAVDWQIPIEEMVLSDKDKAKAPGFKENYLAI